MEERIDEIEKEILDIRERNLRVEADKAWETSKFRTLCLMGITYVVAAVALHFIGAQNVFLNALIPTIGFFLSTQSLPSIKRWWIKMHRVI